jgi:hypothetical protein
MDYKGFEIRVSPQEVVLGEDPLGAVTDGFVAEVSKMDPVQDDPEGRLLLDYPFGVAASHLRAATEDEAVEKAKAFIDAGGKPKRYPVHTGEE